jgi:hypothetical protein
MEDLLFTIVFIGSLILFFAVVATIAKHFNLESYIKDEQGFNTKNYKKN